MKVELETGSIMAELTVAREMQADCETLHRLHEEMAGLRSELASLESLFLGVCGWPCRINPVLRVF
jgi:hypothetical protein